MGDYKHLIDEIWGYAETAFTEEKSSELMCEFLESEGFKVNRNIADMPTAYEAVWGEGKPVICFLAEYDALYGMNQTADITEYRPISAPSDNGHGCGHHLLGVGSIRAAVDYRNYLRDNNLKGTVKMVGCPAEEAGSGKAYLAREGYFDDCDIALTWHPANWNMVVTGSSQSCIAVIYKFHGRAAHACNAENGRSALDACELMNVGVNYLREHMESTDRVHYAYLEVGGKAPNVVQAEGALKYFIRSVTNPKCIELYQRVTDCAKGAALMTGTELEVVFDEGLSNTVPNETLEEVYDRAFKKLFVNDYTEEELAYAQSYKDTFDHAMMMNGIPDEIRDKKALRKDMEESPIHSYYAEVNHSDKASMGSTDVGDVSWVVPTAQINTACYGYGAGAHSWQWVAQGKSSIAYKGAMRAGIIMAEAAKEIHDNPQIIEKAKAELKERLAGEEYECLIPSDVKPHVYD